MAITTAIVETIEAKEVTSQTSHHTSFVVRLETGLLFVLDEPTSRLSEHRTLEWKNGLPLEFFSIDFY